MSYISEHTQEDKLKKARILASQAGCLVDFVDLDHLTIDNIRGVDLGISTRQMQGVMLLLGQLSDDLLDIKRLTTESGLLPDDQQSNVTAYMDSALAVLDVSRELFSLHREQEIARYHAVVEVGASTGYVGGFFHGLKKVSALTSDCWIILNDAYNQAVKLEGGHIEQN